MKKHLHTGGNLRTSLAQTNEYFQGVHAKSVCAFAGIAHRLGNKKCWKLSVVRIILLVLLSLFPFPASSRKVLFVTAVISHKLLTRYNVPVAILGSVLLLLGHIPGGRLTLEEALYHQQHARKQKRKLHVM